MGEAYERALVAGVVAMDLHLPNGVAGRQRTVRISLDVIDHIAQQHTDDVIYCLHHAADVLAHPEYLGHRSGIDPRRVEFVSRVGNRQQLVLVAVKFLDESSETWVTTAHFFNEHSLTRRQRAGTMQEVRRGP